MGILVVEGEPKPRAVGMPEPRHYAHPCEGLRITRVSGESVSVSSSSVGSSNLDALTSFWTSEIVEHEDERDSETSARTRSFALSKREVRNAVAHLANHLISDLKSDFVVLLSRTSIEGASVALAAFDAGVPLVPLNFRWTRVEALKALSTTLGKDSSFVFVCDGFCEAQASHILNTMSLDLWRRCTGLTSLNLAKRDRGNDNLLVLRHTKRVLGQDREGERTERIIDLSVDRELHFKSSSNKDGEAVAAVLFTSGTTSRQPKGAMLTQQSFWWQAKSKINILDYDHDNVHVHCAPLHHVAGLCALVTALHSTAKAHIFVPKFSPRAFVSAILLRSSSIPLGDVLKENVCILAVPSMLVQMHDHLIEEKIGNLDMSNVKVALLGGDAVNERVAKMCGELFPRARLFCTYGMTEACSSIAIRQLLEVTSSASKASSSVAAEEGMRQEEGMKPLLGGHYVGLPCPHIQVAISISTTRGNIALTSQPEVVGEVCLRGPSVCLGYLNRRESTSASFLCSKVGEEGKREERWFLTGDLGWLDRRVDPKGRGLHICGRRSDAIRSGAEMIYPSDVERALHALNEKEGLKECVVFRIKDAVLGEKACALVVIEKSHLRQWKGEVLTLSLPLDTSGDTGGERTYFLISENKRRHLKTFLTQNISSYKVPKVIVVTTIPLVRNATGKIDRRASLDHILPHLTSATARSKL